MRQRKADEVGAPGPEELAAYADGELDGAARGRVKDWLRQHPQAAAEVEALRRLDRLCQAAAPDPPDEAAWAPVLRRIEERTAPRPTRRRSAAAVLARILVPLAAAVLLAVLLHRPAQTPTPQGVEPVEAFPVVTPDEVEIISLADADHAALLVGRPPLSEPIVLVGPGDMGDINMKPDVDGMIPKVASPAEGMGTTIIVAPLGWSGLDTKDD